MTLTRAFGTRRTVRHGAVAAILGTLVLASPAAAQNDPQPSGERGTELSALAGAGANATHTGAAFSGIAGWQMTHWLTAEARGTWLARGAGAEAFEADLGVRTRLASAHRLAPFAGAGFGLYRASFEGATALAPSFYARRFGATGVGAVERAFTDPAFRFTAGVDVRTGGRLTLRPEVSALVARRDGRSETVALVGVGIGYRFEDHPVTP